MRAALTGVGAIGSSNEDPPRTRKSSLTLAAVKPWGDWVRYRHARDRPRVYGIAAIMGQARMSEPSAVMASASSSSNQTPPSAR
jgi:hypothetical protein